MQDAPETIEKTLRNEQDLSTRRNAFVMLSNYAQDRAVRFLFENLESVSSWGDILQMAVLELIRKVGLERKGTSHKAIPACVGSLALLGRLAWDHFLHQSGDCFCFEKAPMAK
eukprot:1147146-Pelagomonas_calceolata.AAC.17